MNFNNVLGQDNIKNHLKNSIESGRIPHAQLFIGNEGVGTLEAAIDFASAILNKDKVSPVNFSHPDLYYVYPNFTTEDIKTKAKSIDFIDKWRTFLEKFKYGNAQDWTSVLDEGSKKQGFIGVNDAIEINRFLSLKSYQGSYKIVIIWQADKMNIEASNKLLKLLEEPTDSTLFILISENEEDILQTIRSRCQVIHFPPLKDEDIIDALVNYRDIDQKTALNIAKQVNGNFNKALKLLSEDSDILTFEKWFVDWVRAAYKAKGNAEVIIDLINWSDTIAALTREKQKSFLLFCIDIFRQALLINYKAPSLVYFEPQVDKFKLENFAPFVNGGNINAIFAELSDAMLHVERNGNAKLIFSDLSIKLTRLIHQK